MLVKLTPGVYKVEAFNAGSAQTKTLTVPAKAAASHTFYRSSPRRDTASGLALSAL
jgi:hypothetical protein